MAYPDMSSRSATLNARARKTLPGGNTRTTVYAKPYPVYAVRGEGCRVWDVDDVQRVDCINNFTSLIHGHSHPALIDAAVKQLHLGSAFGAPTESEIDLAELHCGRIPSMDQIRFSNSGTEAVMTGIKAARAFTGRPKIAKVEGSYHGTYDYAEISLETKPETWKQGPPSSVGYAKGTPQGAIDDVVVIPFNDTDGAVSIIRAHGPELACVMVDPMPNRAGLVPADRAYIQALREVTKEVGALLLVDEVITFRLGHGGAQPIWGIEADITALAKIIGGGFPVGATGGSAEVMTVFDPTQGKPDLSQGGTFSANPVTMRAGLAGMENLDEDAFAHLEAIGEAMRAGIDEAMGRHGVPGGTTGMGSLLKIHFTDRPVRDYRSAHLTPEETARQSAFYAAVINEGVIMAPTGLMALSTPMTSDDVSEVVEGISRALAKVA